MKQIKFAITKRSWNLCNVIQNDDKRNSYGREIRHRINRNADFLRYLTTLLYLFLCGHNISRNANKNFMTNYLNFNGVDFLCILANKKQNNIQFQINVDWRLAASKIFVLKKWMQFFFSFYASTNETIYFFRFRRVILHLRLQRVFVYVDFCWISLYRETYRYFIHTHEQ